MEKLKEEAKKSGDVKCYAENREKGFKSYLERCKVNFRQKMPRAEQGQVNVVLLGKISSGKSSLLNSLLELK